MDQRICWLLTILFATKELTAESARLVEMRRPARSRAIIDKRGPVGADVGQKLLTKAVEPGGRQIALASQLVHIHDNLFARADRARVSADCKKSVSPFRQAVSVIDS